MKKLVSIIAVIGLIGCSDKNTYVVDGCVVEPDNGGQRITCGSDTITIPDQLPILKVVDPCGDGPGVDEVVLVLEGNLYLAWYKNVGLVILNEMTKYRTTDPQQCRFSIINGEMFDSEDENPVHDKNKCGGRHD